MPSAVSPSGRPGIDLDLARTFVAICDSGNFSKAAERVHRTPSAVSLQVKRLEDMLGRALFRREARSVVLTADGEMLLGYARRLLALSDEAMAHFVLPPMEGKVRLGAPFDSGVIAIPAILAGEAARRRLPITAMRIAIGIVFVSIGLYLALGAIRLI